MKSVHELNQDELEELKWNFFYNEEVEHDFDFPYEISNEILFEYYAHISFVEEDFSCNI